MYNIFHNTFLYSKGSRLFELQKRVVVLKNVNKLSQMLREQHR